MIIKMTENTKLRRVQVTTGNFKEFPVFFQTALLFGVFDDCFQTSV